MISSSGAEKSRSFKVDIIRSSVFKTSSRLPFFHIFYPTTSLGHSELNFQQGAMGNLLFGRRIFRRFPLKLIAFQCFFLMLQYLGQYPVSVL